MKSKVKSEKPLARRSQFATAIGLRIIVILFFTPFLAHAQSNNDFGISSNISLEKRLLKNRLSLGLDGEFRSQANSTRAERYVVGIDAAYKIIDKKKYTFKAGLGYEHQWLQTLSQTEDKYKLIYEEKPRHEVYDEGFSYAGNGQFLPKLAGYTSGYNTGINDGYNINERYWHGRSRVNLHAAFTYKPNKRFSFTLKETFQYSHYYACEFDQYEYRDKYRVKTRFKERYDDNGVLQTLPTEVTTEQYSTSEWVKETKNAKDKFMLRSKLTAEYNIKKSPFTPFISADYGVGLGYYAHKFKATAGTDIKINKHHSFDVWYRFQTETDDDEPNGHLLGVGYQFKF